jgi:hypothetical protein
LRVLRGVPQTAIKTLEYCALPYEVDAAFVEWRLKQGVQNS